jgi:hypothetical protein
MTFDLWWRNAAARKQSCRKEADVIEHEAEVLQAGRAIMMALVPFISM